MNTVNRHVLAVNKSTPVRLVRYVHENTKSTQITCEVQVWVVEFSLPRRLRNTGKDIDQISGEVFVDKICAIDERHVPDSNASALDDVEIVIAPLNPMMRKYTFKINYLE